MAQRKSTPIAPASGDERVGPYALAGLLRRDRLGEVYAGEGPDGTVRVRIATPRDDPAPITAVLDQLAQLSHPALAPLLDQLVDPDGRIAVVTPADRWTLADRRRAGRLDASTVGPLGCVLLDGLAELHAAGLAHGAVSATEVGIDAEGAPRWEDAALLPALSGSRTDPALRRAADVADCASLLRDLGSLPPELEAVLDPVASGVPGAIEEAAPLAVAWREALESLELPVPPPGVRARIPGLLAPPPRPASRLRARTLPAWARPVAIVALVAAALAVVPVAALTPGGAPLADRIDAYAPPRKGMELTYHLRGSGLDATVTLRVSDVRTIAGELTASLEVTPPLQSGGATLPLGLGGSTIRVGAGSIVRTASGGSVRDLLLPLAPGQSWHDRRTGVITVQTVDEQRTVLGPLSLSTAGRRFDRCVAVALASTTRLASSETLSGSGTLWYCPGVGLARAHLVASGQPLDIELTAVR
ncbi:MAG TPA: hypothetical protein VN193_03520 [Candidatus Angelobacter sp.]|jgi:hypothetical protein|nr:hypothetical protein [Candidatus Angelobacter sp.]